MNQKVAGNGILKENKKNWIEISVFAALVAIASAVTFWLFYRQCVESMQGTGLYHSDMKAYILEMQGLDSGYSFPYPILFKLAAGRTMLNVFSDHSRGLCLGQFFKIGWE